MKKSLKKHKFDFLFFSLFSIPILFWVFHDKTLDITWNALSIITIIASLYFTFLHFRIKLTLDKINAVTLSPEVSKYVVLVIKFIDKEKKENRTQLINEEIIEEDLELFTAVNFLLGFGDDLSIAIMNGFIEESLAKEMIGRFINRLYNGLWPYIESGDNISNKSRYPNFITLQRRWADLG